MATRPNAEAIVDGETRLTYAQWYARISSLVAAFDRIGLKPGDHVITALQNCEAAATLHWACQFAGIIITPLSWRSTAEDLNFCIEDAGAIRSHYTHVNDVGATVLDHCLDTRNVRHRQILLACPASGRWRASGAFSEHRSASPQAPCFSKHRPTIL